MNKKPLPEADPKCTICSGTGLIMVDNLDNSYQTICECVDKYIKKHGAILGSEEEDKWLQS